MKKLSLFMITFFLCLVGCQNTPSQHSTSTTAQKNIKTVTVTTSFLADIVKEIAGETVTVETLIPAGEDPHLYIAKASDLDKLSKADLVLYHGLHFEGKMVEALEKTGVAVTKDFPNTNLLQLEEDGETVTDPHFWFNIDLYKIAVQTVSAQLKKLLPEQSDTFEKATLAYLSKLDDLKLWATEQLQLIPENSRYLITPHDAFNYFASSFNFNVHAPQGVSTASEVDNNAMIETVNLIIDKKVKAIFVESTTNPERMEKLQEAVKAKGGNVTVVSGEGKELLSDSLAPQGHEGDNYITMFKHNITLIVDHLK